jgi:hypothetical protein
MHMADNKIVVNYVQSCNLGKFGTDGIALKINFATSAEEFKAGRYQNVVFGLSHELTRGLAKALNAILKDTTATAQTKQTQN